jgi:hypothetical protein
MAEIQLIVRLTVSEEITDNAVMQEIVDNVATAIKREANECGITPDDYDGSLERIEVVEPFSTAIAIRKEFYDSTGEGDTYKPTQEQIDEFVKLYGLTDTELSNELDEDEDEDSDSDSLTDLAVNLGYVWLNRFERWILSSNMLYTSEEQKIAEYLEDTDK